MLLLDKDNWFKLPTASDSDTYPSKPTSKGYHDCCNEFWWVAPYVAKGLWRQELAYARHMLDNILRTEVFKMMNWYFGIKTDFNKSPGKFGKNFLKYIEPEYCDLLTKSYDAANLKNTWVALENICMIFSQVAQKVGLHFNYDYPFKEDELVSAHLMHVKKLAGDARVIY